MPLIGRTYKVWRFVILQRDLCLDTYMFQDLPDLDHSRNKCRLQNVCFKINNTSNITYVFEYLYLVVFLSSFAVIFTDDDFSFQSFREA